MINFPPNADGTLQDIDTQSCWERLYWKFLKRLIGNRVVLMNVEIKPTFFDGIVIQNDDTKFYVVNTTFPLNVIIKANK